MNKIPFPKFKDYAGQPVRYIQSKFDGHLVKVYKRAYEPKGRWDGRIIALSKNDKDMTDKLCAINHIHKELLGLPSDSQIFAELHCPGRFSTDVKTMLNAADSDLRLTAFAAPTIRGKNWSFMPLPVVMEQLRAHGIESTKTVIRQMESISKIAQQAMLADAIEQKLEGWVLKESHMDGWYKLKPTKTVDCFVTGTTMSTSASHYGGLKSIDVAVRAPGNAIMTLGTVGGGFKADFRMEHNTKEKRKTLVGRVCEVEYDSLAAGGKLRFPRVLRWREDKNKEDCTSNQL
ncbi:hypothetical protein LCGC14_0377740 [marine sediment metagenome]|uniref:ATP-dependent DNA ligase family profile domain-containing protein n=1 Tax=marine sediment metagenome TaxID=412755 RepID=A0A0F9TL68_9ZZZZ